MASPVDRVIALKVEIANFEFKYKIRQQWKVWPWGRDIDEICDEINALNAQLADLRGRLSELVFTLPAAERIDLAIRDQQTRSLISALPYEMLSAIFEKAPIDSSTRTRFALSVSQVSRFWRETAIQTTFLWSGIYLAP